MAGRALGALLMAIVLGGALDGCSRSPSHPDPSPGPPSSPFLGTWTGTITSDAIGLGSAVVVLNMELRNNNISLLSGNWSFSFPDKRFSTSGLVSASPALTPTVVVMFFDHGLVPCPAEPGGIADQGIVANLEIDGSRLHGHYITGLCPQGTIDLTRK